jgi:hypothetical protein
VACGDTSRPEIARTVEIVVVRKSRQISDLDNGVGPALSETSTQRKRRRPRHIGGAYAFETNWSAGRGVLDRVRVVVLDLGAHVVHTVGELTADGEEDADDDCGDGGNQEAVLNGGRTAVAGLGEEPA